MFNLNIEAAKAAANFVNSKFNVEIPTTAIILGSGLGTFTQKVQVLQSIPYAEIPGFPASNVVGHKACLSLAQLDNGKTVIVLEGRFHYYEGIPTSQVVLPVTVLHFLGVKNLIVSNAAGGANKNFAVGDLMIIDDQINFTGNNPLIGHNDSELGPRFVDMSEPYSFELIELAKNIATKINLSPKQGTYLSVSGPTYETRAEVRAFAALGADAIGMSTVYEVIVANYFKMQVLGISCITNMATGIATTKHDHSEVVNAANRVADNFGNWVKLIAERI